MLIPAASLSNSPVRWCSVPTPPVPKLSLPGLRFRERHVVLEICTGKSLLTSITSGSRPMMVTCAKILAGVVGLLQQRGVDRLRGHRGGEPSVAVGRRLRDRVAADDAAPAGAILDHEGLAELSLQRVGERAAENVGGAGRRRGRDQPHQPCRPWRLRPGGADRQRDQTSDECATGRRHGVTSRSLHVASPSESMMHQARSGPAPSDMTAMPIALAAAIDLVIYWSSQDYPRSPLQEEPLSRVLRVAAAQSGPIQKADSRQAVVRRMIDLLDQAKAQKCDLVVYTELALTTFFPRWYMTDQAEVDAWFEREMPNPATRPLFEKAAEHKIAHIVRLCRAHARRAGASIRRS